MRKVADESGIAVGHLQHFFSTKAILLKKLFCFLAEEHINHYTGIIEQLSNGEPNNSLSAVIDFLLDDVSNANTKPFFIEFWALSLRNTDVRDEMDSMHAHHLKFLAGLISQNIPKLDKELCEFRAIQVTSLIDGLLIYSAQIDANSEKYSRLIDNTHKTLLRLMNDPE